MCKASYAGTAPFAFPKPVELDEASSGFHYFTTGAFGAAVALVFMQLLDAEKKGPSWNAQLYCALLINCIALFGQFGVAYHIVHPVENIFGRVVLIPRLLEWVSLVPMLMFMTFSLDVRTNEDVLRLWAYTIIQQFSVVCGCYANLTDNYTFAVVLLVLSSVAFLSIYVAVYFAFRRIESVTMEAMAEEERNTPINPKRRSSSSFELESDRVLRRMTPIKISEVLASVENVGVTMSFQLTLYCAIFWTVIAIVYFLGVFNIIDSNTEACIQAAVDFMTKCVYVQVLATSHGTVLSPEGVLMRLLILEERANAVFRQVFFFRANYYRKIQYIVYIYQSIRFVFHELSTPLNTIAIGIETLAGQRLSEQGQEYLEGVQEGTNAIMDSLNDVRYLQVYCR